MILPVFKTGERQVRPVSGAFDSHTLPPFVFIPGTQDLACTPSLTYAPFAPLLAITRSKIFAPG